MAIVCASRAARAFFVARINGPFCDTGKRFPTVRCTKSVGLDKQEELEEKNRREKMSQLEVAMKLRNLAKDPDNQAYICSEKSCIHNITPAHSETGIARLFTQRIKQPLPQQALQTCTKRCARY